MDHNQPSSTDDARAIVDAMRQVQARPELRALAHQSPQAVADRLGLKGVARQAVAAGLSALVTGAAVGGSAGTLDFWY